MANQAVRRTRAQVVHLHVEKVRAPLRRETQKEVAASFVLAVGFVLCVIFAAVLFYGRAETKAAAEVAEAAQPTLLDLMEAKQEALESVE